MCGGGEPQPMLPAATKQESSNDAEVILVAYTYCSSCFSFFLYILYIRRDIRLKKKE